MTTEHAGTEGHLLRLIRALDRRFFQPLLIVLQRSPWTDRFDDPLVPLKVLGMGSFMDPRSWGHILKLGRVLREERVDVVESHFPDAHFVGALAARLAGVPISISCRRDLVDQYGWKKLALCKLGNRFATHHLANSQAVATVSARVEQIDPARISVIRNGVDLDFFDRPSAVPTIPEFQAAAQSRVIVHVANLWSIKNIPMFIEAASIVLKQVDDVRFAVIGSGPEDKQLKQLAAARGLMDRMIWTGSASDVRPYLRQSAIGCLCSDAEGLPNAILEYMAAGLPVVATSVGGSPEAIVDGVTGYLVGKNDAQTMAARLIEILSQPSRRREMGIAGRRRVEEFFSLQVQVAAHQRLYEQLTGAARAVAVA